MIIEITKLLGMRGELEDIRTALTPDTLEGITEARQAREYVFDVIDEMKKWEGTEIEPARITLACRKLDKATDLIGPYDEAIGCEIFAVMGVLEAIENDANDEGFMNIPEDFDLYSEGKQPDPYILIGVTFDGGGSGILNLAPGSVPFETAAKVTPGEVKIDINGNVTMGKVVDISEIPAYPYIDALKNNLPFN